MKKSYFIQKLNLKKGSLRRSLGIPKGKKIPLSLLNRIISAKSGQVIRNPTKVGKRRIRVTRKIERRSILARNLINLRKRR